MDGFPTSIPASHVSQRGTRTKAEPAMTRRSPLSAQRSARNVAALVEELDPPTPFTFEGFRAWLEEHCGRSVLLVPTVMPPCAPSGVWLRTAAVDYLHYEQRTSPFHQAHIVTSLAAHLLLGPEGVSRQLVPDLQLQADRPFHGVDISDEVRRFEPEAFAFEILRRSGSFPGALQSRILLRRLQPLQRALPTAAIDVRAQAGAVRRLHHSVVAIRDAALATGFAATDDFTPKRRSGYPRPTSPPADLRAETLALIHAAESYTSKVLKDHLTESSNSLL